MRWTPPQEQARRFLVAVGSFWLLWGVIVGEVVLGYKIEAGDSTSVGPRDFLGPRGDRGIRSQMVAPFNVMRPSFFRDVAVASGWNVIVVLGVLVLLAAADLALFLLVETNSPEVGR